MKIVTDYDGCPYITAGKEYDVLSCGPSLCWVKIMNDDGDEITLLPGDPCPHLDGHTCMIVSE